MKTAIFILVIIISLSSCTREMNPVDSTLNSGGAGNMILQTNEIKYSWQKSESNYSIIIEGTLKNKSLKTYYSDAGNPFIVPQPNILLFAENSAGNIEKYDASNKSWREIHILGLLIEGSSPISIAPATNYTIYAHLNRKNDEIEKGKYRLRIDYTETPNPEISEARFEDFSNIFEIE
jgi:hypothetical protein